MFSLRAGVLLHRWFFGPGQILPPEKSPAAEPTGWTSPSCCDQCVPIQVYASWSSFPKQTNAVAHYNSGVNLQPADAAFHAESVLLRWKHPPSSALKLNWDERSMSIAGPGY